VTSGRKTEDSSRISRLARWRFHVALVLAHEAEYRADAIRALRWSDMDLKAREVR